jgi:Delta24-sterol reductase
MDSHNERLQEVVARVRQFHKSSTPFRIYHGSTNSTRVIEFDRDAVVDTSKLNKVLAVNTHTKTALVEPNVPMDVLVSATLKHNLIPPVVMEFPGITVGGGFVGTGGESSSFRHGFFDSTTNWIEMVLATGEIKKASRTENEDLFRGAAGSFGTLGILTLLEIRLIDAAMYVELTYHPVKSVEAIVQGIGKATEIDINDYVEGIILNKNQGVIITGHLTNDVAPNSYRQRFLRARDPWFFTNVQDIFKNSTTTVVQTVPIADYLFRYDRGAFWTGKYAFSYFLMPFNWFTRWLLDYFMHTRVMYHALHKSGLAKQYIIQDLALPSGTAQAFIDYVDRTLGIYPLWLCPLRADGKLSMSPYSESAQKETTEKLLNVGVWGMGSKKKGEFIQENRDIEEVVKNLGGVKWLYAQTYYTEDEFWSIYDRESYDKLRMKYHASALPDVYTKVKANVDDASSNLASVPFLSRDWCRNILFKIWPLGGLYGVFRATVGGDYLLKKQGAN